MPVFRNGGADALRGDGGALSLPRGGHGLEHPLGTDDAVRPGQSLPGLLGLHVPAAGADAHHRHLLPGYEAEAPAEHIHGLLQIRPGVLGRAADDNGGNAAGLGGGNLILEAPGGAGGLGHQIGGPQGLEGGGVQLLGEGALHGQNVAGL